MNRERQAVESLLVDLGRHVDWPEPSDLGSGVSRRLAIPPVRRRRRRWIPVTATLVVLVASLLLFSPQARQAVADLLGVAGIEIEFLPGFGRPVGADLDLGRAVGLEEAGDSVDFTVSVPGELGDPDGAYLADRPAGGRVDLVWEGDDAVPAAGDSGVGLLYSQFRVNLDGEIFAKSLGPDTDLVPVEVGGLPAFWIEGAPHLLSFEDASGSRVEETTRLAGNVLMWETGGVTHRIETMLGLEQTLRIAESIEPIAN